MTLTFDLWPWKSIGFQTLIRTKYVPSLVKIHWRMLILECSQGCYVVNIWPGDRDFWPMTMKINRVPDSRKDYICTKFGQNPLKHVDSRVVTRMLRKDGRTDGSVTISLRNFVGEGIIKRSQCLNINKNFMKDTYVACPQLTGKISRLKYNNNLYRNLKNLSQWK